jgi:hypothetical protein
MQRLSRSEGAVEAVEIALPGHDLISGPRLRDSHRFHRQYCYYYGTTPTLESHDLRTH